MLQLLFPFLNEWRRDFSRDMRLKRYIYALFFSAEYRAKSIAEITRHVIVKQMTHDDSVQYLKL